MTAGLFHLSPGEAQSDQISNKAKYRISRVGTGSVSPRLYWVVLGRDCVGISWAVSSGSYLVSITRVHSPLALCLTVGLVREERRKEPEWSRIGQT
ncbi:hypothetical protein SKAU_G00254190 [Synaphobranchus kaupii]|uniref:Uncharacterized protein n=1 Tax=Synaphobranchus kaupii TaxID=118154 RepID=A0A9Q1F3F5_SYNKA|nr:hypothetical protein SKAU_G00254190 [Synaphobranchus kaupii]